MIKIMEIPELLDENYIVDIKSNTKDKALEELIEVIGKNENITNIDAFRQEIFNREKLMSTGIGYEIAVPHARHKSVKDFVMAIGRKKEGLEYQSIDDTPVKLLIMIGASDKQDKDYIKLLSRVVLRLKNQEYVKKILAAKNPNEVYNIIKEQR